MSDERTVNTPGFEKKQTAFGHTDSDHGKHVECENGPESIKMKAHG